MSSGAHLATLLEGVRRLPRDHAAWHAIALLHLRAGSPDLALPAAQRAVALDRRNAEYLNTLGVVLAEAGSPDEAMRSLRDAATARPSHYSAFYNQGKLLLKLGRHDEALAALERARKLAPERDEIREYLGRVLRAAGRPEQAHAVFAELARERPDSALAARCFAESLALTAGPAAARDAFAAAVARFPADAELHWLHARFLLATGEFAAGWAEYLWRPTRDPRLQPPRGTPYEGMAPGLLQGKTVHLMQEQGIGDAVFFARFAHLLRAQGCRVTVGCHPKLAPVLARVPLIDWAGAGRPETPAHVGTMLDDLPALLKAAAPVPPLALPVDEDNVARWKKRLGALGPAPFIAVTWRAGTDRLLQREFGEGAPRLFKQIDIAPFAHSLRGLAGTLLSVQREPAPGEIEAFAGEAGRPVHDFSALNEDLAAMTDFLGAIDDYVGVSNTNMHLAAGVGRAARVLVPYPPEWRWMLEGEASPWFPGFRVYRQNAQGQWDGALARLRSDLQEASHGRA